MQEVEEEELVAGELKEEEEEEEQEAIIFRFITEDSDIIWQMKNDKHWYIFFVFVFQILMAFSRYKMDLHCQRDTCSSSFNLKHLNIPWQGRFSVPSFSLLC